MKLAFGIEYDGSRYHGWQRQKNTPITVQETVEEAMSKLANEQVSIVCAGRTDAGVHAFQQVVHMETTKQRAAHEWVLGTNSHLPDDIRLVWIKPVGNEFHARFSAAARYYRYDILNRWVKSALHRNHVTTIFNDLDISPMQKAANCLIGTHDFSSFRAQDCQAKSPIKHMHSISITRTGDKIRIDIIANAFLHHMVRNIVGTLLPIGKNEKPPEWMRQVLVAKDRKVAGATAPPNGLYFKGVYYPKKFGIDSLEAFEPFCDVIETNTLNQLEYSP
jgi:tRNA pseudouridine38-40 synthase